jgi:hypothetical protein
MYQKVDVLGEEEGKKSKRPLGSFTGCDLPEFEISSTDPLLCPTMILPLLLNQGLSVSK